MNKQQCNSDLINVQCPRFCTCFIISVQSSVTDMQHRSICPWLKCAIETTAVQDFIKTCSITMLALSLPSPPSRWVGFPPLSCLTFLRLEVLDLLFHFPISAHHTLFFFFLLPLPPLLLHLPFTPSSFHHLVVTPSDDTYCEPPPPL